MGQLLIVRRLQPSNQQAQLLLGDIWLSLGEYQKVADLLMPAAKADPQNKAIAYLVASALVKSGDVEKGERIAAVLFQGGDTPEALMLRAMMQVSSSASKDAVSLLNQAIALQPNLPGAQTLLGKAYLERGR